MFGVMHIIGLNCIIRTLCTTLRKKPHHTTFSLMSQDKGHRRSSALFLEHNEAIIYRFFTTIVQRSPNGQIRREKCPRTLQDQIYRINLFCSTGKRDVKVFPRRVTYMNNHVWKSLVASACMIKTPTFQNYILK